MKDPKDPVQQLTDTLTLLRVEIADVKNRQITEKQLKHLLAALENTAVQVEAVAQSAGEGAQRALQPLSRQMGHTSQNMQDSTQRALQGLSEALRAIHGNFLSQKRFIGLLLLFSALFGVGLGAFGGLWIGDYKLATEFGKTPKQTPEAQEARRAALGRFVTPST